MVGDRSVCNGLLRDWVSWQREPDQDERSPFHLLTAVLDGLSPPRELLRPGAKPVRLAVGESIDYPTLVSHDGEPIPVVHASAAVQRVLALSYLLVWTWSEHLQAARLLRQEPTRRVSNAPGTSRRWSMRLPTW